MTGNAAGNRIDSGPGGDDVAGGAGVDTMDYSRRVESLYVELSGASEFGDATDGPEGARDSIDADVENVIGGTDDDWLLGRAADNHLAGEGGDDLLTGEAGADVLAGGAGADIVDYVDRAAPLTIDLDGVAGDDVFVLGHSVGADVEGIWGLCALSAHRQRRGQSPRRRARGRHAARSGGRLRPRGLPRPSRGGIGRSRRAGR